MKYLLQFLWLFIYLSCYSQVSKEKINGVCLVSPPAPTSQEQLTTVKQINANWVALIPYAFMRGYSTKIKYNTNFQWWGERLEGVTTLIKQAQKDHLKIMLKPHLWVSGDGWAGDFFLKTEIDWLQWEASYTQYIMAYAKVAQQNHIELFCIGTELRQVAKQRPEFWKQLILNVRKIYSGKLTYASNWDNYHNISFWKYLDYIGVDAYFPLSNEKTPSTDSLEKAWHPIKEQLKNYSVFHKKPIIFTEFGYTSSNFNTKESWSNSNNYSQNQQAQVNAYEAIFKNFWNNKWFAGGFLWKWHLHNKTKHAHKTNFTPQGKKAINTIKHWYQ